MMRLAAVLALFLILPAASAELDAEIRQDCGNEEALISMADPDDTYSNPGPPDMYEWSVCVSGIQSSNISTSCEKNTGFYLSSREEDAHFSTFDSYNLHVCTGDLEVITAKNSCPENHTVLFSASSKDNAHVAKPATFDTKVCGSGETLRNVTLTAEFNLSSSDKVYFDGQKVENERSFRPPAEMAYISSESESFVSGIVAPSFLEARRSIDQKNSLKFTRSLEKASFYLPLTQGDRNDIEDRQKPLNEKLFLDNIRPSFGFVMPEEPLVRVIYDPELDLVSDIYVSPGRYSITTKKTGPEEVNIN